MMMGMMVMGMVMGMVMVKVMVMVKGALFFGGRAGGSSIGMGEKNHGGRVGKCC